MNDVNSVITARAIETLAPQAGEVIADIGPGNGTLSLPIVEALGDGGRYFGIELSDDMAPWPRRLWGQRAALGSTSTMAIAEAHRWTPPAWMG